MESPIAAAPKAPRGNSGFWGSAKCKILKASLKEIPIAAAPKAPRKIWILGSAKGQILKKPLRNGQRAAVECPKKTKGIYIKNWTAQPGVAAEGIYIKKLKLL